jgi:hypothetical protein
MTDRDKIFIECRRIVQLTAALAAAIERLGAAVAELMPPPAEDENQTEVDRIN